MLHLPDIAKQNPLHKKIIINERLPSFVKAPCQVSVSYSAAAKDDFYTINLEVEAVLDIICQRCMGEFILPYKNSTVIAVCRTDERAEQLLEHYECIVAANWTVSLDDLIIDELHLYVSQFHPEVGDCDSGINDFLTAKIETY